MITYPNTAKDKQHKLKVSKSEVEIEVEDTGVERVQGW